MGRHKSIVYMLWIKQIEELKIIESFHFCLVFLINLFIEIFLDLNLNMHYKLTNLGNQSRKMYIIKTWVVYSMHFS